MHGWTEASVRLVVRTTARTSLVLFLLAFSASSLRRLAPTPATGWLLHNRRYLGVAFAGSHFLHLGALVALGLAFPQPFRSELHPLTLVGGGFAYVLIAAMATPSSEQAADRLGARRWRRLHTLGIWYVWLLFAQSYAPRALVRLRALTRAPAVSPAPPSAAG